MKQSKNGATADRRSFLKLAGAGVATAGGGLAAASASSSPAADAETKGKLYRETEHVRKYYELARD